MGALSPHRRPRKRNDRNGGLPNKRAAQENKRKEEGVFRIRKKRGFKGSYVELYTVYMYIYIERDAVERRRRRQPSSYSSYTLFSSCYTDTCSQDNTLLLFKRTPAATHSKSPAKKNPTPIVNLYSIRLISNTYIRQFNRKKNLVPCLFDKNRSKLMVVTLQNRYHQSDFEATKNFISIQLKIN